MRVSCAKLACGDSLGGGATVAMFLGGTEGDCVLICCSTAAWFMVLAEWWVLVYVGMVCAP